MVDPDTLSHLAIGRWIAQHRAIPRTDPFTFARPDTRSKYPEGPGDLLWFGLWSAGGEGAMRLAQVVATAGGFLLVARAASQLGASPSLTLLLLLLLLPAAASSFTLRNHIHGYWLVPLYLLVPLGARRRGWLWLLLVPLGWLWSHLHASFVLGWAVLAAFLVDASLRREPIPWRWALPALVLQPVLPLLGPNGAAAYLQLWDHSFHSSLYRRYLVEWQSPLFSSAWLAVLPVHLHAALGLVALVRLRRGTSGARKGVEASRGRGRKASEGREGTSGARKGVEASRGGGRKASEGGLCLLMVAGLAMAYLSRRFMATGGILAAPAIALGLTGLGAGWSTARRRVLWVAATVLLAGYAVAAADAARRSQVGVMERPDGPQAAAGFIARHAPPGSRIFNSYNAGPWLTWMTAPRHLHYIDPRNNLGADFVEHYLELTRDPTRLAGEISRHRISLALLELGDPGLGRLIELLDQAADWSLVFLDGRHAVYARHLPANRPLVAASGYRALGARLTRQDLGSPDAPTASMVSADLARLKAQAPALAELISACREVLTGATAARLERLRLAFLQPHIQRLPPSGALLACQVAVLRGLGQHELAQQAAAERARLFPADATPAWRVNRD